MTPAEIVARFRDREISSVEAVRAIRALVSAERKACIAIVESEPELPGPMPVQVETEVGRVGLERAIRAAVIGTKEAILRRLRVGLEAHS